MCRLLLLNRRACFVAAVLAAYFVGYTFANYSGCASNDSCQKCGSSGCMKCKNLIVFPTRECVTVCPHGFKSQWSTRSDYMGRICVHRGTFLGLSQETLTVLTGVLCGSFLCIVVISFAIFYVHYRRKIVEIMSEAGSDLDDTPEKREFLKQVDTLRPHAATFLEMLNDTRKQLRDSHADGDTAAAAIYKPIIRDLAKILILLNRPIEKLSVPDDWEHLFNWAEKNLRRFKRLSEISQPQVAQLISFLQTPSMGDGGNRPPMSTFKPDQEMALHNSALSLHALEGNNKGKTSPDGEANEDVLNPQWKFDEFDAGNTLSQFNPILWKNSKEYLYGTYFLDDDFCQLGFRPQDEIVTEL